MKTCVYPSSSLVPHVEICYGGFNIFLQQKYFMHVILTKVNKLLYLLSSVGDFVRQNQAYVDSMPHANKCWLNNSLMIEMILPQISLFSST